jgi:hypothetical protein
MSYILKLEGFEGQKVEVMVSFWTGPKLTMNGQPPQKGLKRGEMLLSRNDDRQVVATWTPQMMGLDVPQLVVDGKTISLATPLKWYQWVWSALPILLIFLGGLLGGITGVMTFTINTGIFRSRSNEIMKYVVTGVISIVAVIVYLIVGSYLYASVNQ